MNMGTKEDDLSETALKLARRGYHVIPLAPSQKAAVDRNWTKLRLTVDDVTQRWDEMPELGVGLLLGTEVATGVYLAAIDIDRDDDLLITRVRAAIGGHDVPAKRGAKGITFIVRTTAPLKKVLIKKKGEAIATVEVLAAGQQTVLPPSLHPKGGAYHWKGQQLHRVDPDDLPLLEQETIKEIEVAVKNPDAKMFLINDMMPPVDGQPGSIHDSCMLAIASMVAYGLPDDWIRQRVMRAIGESAQRGGVERNESKESYFIGEMLTSSRAKEFDVERTGSEKPDVEMARYLRDEWLGGGSLYTRGGQMLIYKDGHFLPRSPDAFYRELATCERADIAGLGHNGWKLITNTALAMVPEFPSPPHRRICLLNGTFDLDTGELGSHNKSDFLISQLDFLFDPEANCPLYEAFMARTFANDDVEETIRAIATFEEYVVMTLFECHDFHRFLVFEGTTRGGKSVLNSIASGMHSPEAISSVMAHDFGKESSRTSMLGKLVNITGETSTVSGVADDYLKLIVAGERVDVRHLYHGAFSTVLPTRLIIATNDPLKTKDTSGAVMERMLVLRCDNFVPKPERDRLLPIKLRIERPGIFNRIAKGWKRLQDREGFLPPQSSEDTAERFHRDNNPVLQWVLERTHQGRRIEDPSYAVPEKVTTYCAVNQLYLDYVEWAKMMGFMQMSVITFGMKLTQLKLPGINTATRMQRVGPTAIRVKDFSLIAAVRY